MARIVLIVEDDNQLRQLLKEVFLEERYDVVAFENADDTSHFLTRAAIKLHLMITDFRMPGVKNGLDLALQAKQLRPDLPVIVSSGYYEKRGETIPGVLYLSKPYSLDSLLTSCGL